MSYEQLVNYCVLATKDGALVMVTGKEPLKIAKQLVQQLHALLVVPEVDSIFSPNHIVDIYNAHEEIILFCDVVDLNREQLIEVVELCLMAQKTCVFIHQNYSKGLDRELANIAAVLERSTAFVDVTGHCELSHGSTPIVIYEHTPSDVQLMMALNTS